MKLDRTAKLTITLAALAVVAYAVFYVPFFVALPLLAAFVVGAAWLWKR